MCNKSRAMEWAGVIYRLTHDPHVTSEKNKINKPLCDHYVFLTLRRLHPFPRTRGIYLEHDLSHMPTYLCHSGPSSHSRLSARHPSRF